MADTIRVLPSIHIACECGAGSRNCSQAQDERKQLTRAAAGRGLLSDVFEEHWLEEHGLEKHGLDLQSDQRAGRLQHQARLGASGRLLMTPSAGAAQASRCPMTAAAATLRHMNEPTPSSPPPRSRGIYLLPNLFTTGALFSGFFAIIAASQGRVEAACVAIFIAAILDGRDGRVARMTNTQSEFGVQYDSLSDLVSFGMAPALVMYHWSLHSMKLDGMTLGKIGWLGAFLYAACAAVRLARFNSQIDQQTDKRWFIGLPSPSAAALMASVVWTVSDLGWSGESFRYPALIITAITGLLMVSRLRYPSFKGGKKGPYSDRVPFLTVLVLIAAIIGVVIDPPKVLLAVFGLFVLIGPLLSRRMRKASPDS